MAAAVTEAEESLVDQLLRDIAAHRPGTITHVGLGTYIDPENQGGRLNDKTPSGLVERITLGGRDWLWYKSLPVDVGFIRATAADPWGNLCMDEEAIIGEVLPIAQAAHNSQGIVIAQVQRLLDEPLPPQRVRVPGVLVDHLIVAGDGEHDQTFSESYNPEYCQPAPLEASAIELPRLPKGVRRIIAQRACDEMRPGDLVNLGIGMPEGIARIAAERGLLSRVTLTVESGPIGGMPAGGLSFGASHYPQAIIDQSSQFDFYDGGGLDFAALGAAQIDGQGNVNVSQFGDRFAGVGGFVNISQSARRLVFCGTLTSGKCECAIENGGLKILREGEVKKFLATVEQCCFNAAQALTRGQSILYITERAVFEFGLEGFRLKEIAPGVDLQRNILDQMEFRPALDKIQPMPGHVFE
jgi:propionate CoA-transferase